MQAESGSAMKGVQIHNKGFDFLSVLFLDTVPDTGSMYRPTYPSDTGTLIGYPNFLLCYVISFARCLFPSPLVWQ